MPVLAERPVRKAPRRKAPPPVREGKAFYIVTTVLGVLMFLLAIGSVGMMVAAQLLLINW
ncbi:MAG: hypothetical protein HY716_08455 [Planctomycetes bacterium]|nr:hypothetical protein [Planctomycetota bacterium]